MLFQLPINNKHISSEKNQQREAKIWYLVFQFKLTIHQKVYEIRV